ncbi:Similar to Protein sym1; acc. no. O14142 [Pyronema omphalodes CBS 100304]|uniref:Similar to Protein sym1 acc. no. O14142 n=1 Tax=Pyronema omphalodes (strain CBS 100304) TaxID=1076935 RepID=U4LGB1_PYROM|nr:Similar to Protein sym1; acc. no. O14142 [Pyronema omphalodes CBS 100304]
MPVLTTMITNSTLSGLSDVLAQTLSHLRTKPTLPLKEKAPISISLNSSPSTPAPFTPSPQSTFCSARLIRYMSYGLLWAPLQLSWFSYLATTFPISIDNQATAVFLRVFFDQLLMSPFGLAVFFAWMSLTEGNGWGKMREKMDKVYWGALKGNYVVWPAVQVVNFWVMPLALQLPFASTVGVFWTTYLSLKNEAAEQ